jgi:hypothetical protein
MSSPSNICAEIQAAMIRQDNDIYKYTHEILTAAPGGNKTAEQNLANAEQQLATLGKAWVLNGCAGPPAMPPRVVKILVVLDGREGHYASFGPSPKNDTYFGLSEVIRTLSATGAGSLITCQLTKAHRDPDPGDFNMLSAADQALLKPDYQNFKFDQAGLDLEEFDELWLFGVGGPTETSALTDSELAAISKFMQNGGGVFATGDHEDLGLPLNGRIPRVRTMRKWYFGADQIPAEFTTPPPLAPAGLGPNRNDTTRKGHDDPPPLADGTPAYWFDNQSDDIPQTITPVPVPYVNPATNRRSTSLHPLLSGGAINVLPDHMHEGEVIVPADMTMSVTFAGEIFEEYPKNSDGSQEKPLIVATGQVIKHVTDTQLPFHLSDTAEVQPKTFGVIGAYDGHATDKGLGRVAVDSTWHHFFDLNLIGDPGAIVGGDYTVGGVAPDPTKLHGFQSTPSGQAALATIKAYYINIAVWLAPALRIFKLPPRPFPLPHPQHWHRMHWFTMAVYQLRTTQPLSMLVRKGHKYSEADVLEIGAIGRTALSRRISVEMQIDWLHSYLVERWKASNRKGAPPLSPDRAQARILLDAALGAGVVNVVQNFVAKGPLELMTVQRSLETAVYAGVVRGIGIMKEAMDRQAASIADFAGQLEALGVDPLGGA